MFVKSQQQLVRLLPFLRMQLQPRIDVRADQPGPHGSLVIGRVAGPQIAVVLVLVVGMPWRERPQAPRASAASRDTTVEHALPTRAIENRIVERKRQQLIGPQRRIERTVLAVDHVIKVAALLRTRIAD